MTQTTLIEYNGFLAATIETDSVCIVYCPGGKNSLAGLKRGKNGTFL
jgi:hypothetical protein